jgi:hypothetical protein
LNYKEKQINHTNMRAHRQLSILFLFLISSVIFYSCETADPITSLNQDRVYQIYDVEFRGHSNYTYGRATFRLENAGGSYITLTGGTANVKFNGINMTEVSVFGVVYYQAGVTGTTNPTFAYTDADNRAFSNPVNILSQAVSFNPAPPADLSPIVDNTFSFAAAVQSGETVTLRIYNASNDSLVFTGSNSGVGSTSIVLPANSIQGGNYYAELNRTDQIALVEGNPVGGVINRSFLSTRASFTMIP